MIGHVAAGAPRSKGPSQVAEGLFGRGASPSRSGSVEGTVVLGCTHDLLLARTIGVVMGRDVMLVSSEEETVFEIRAMPAGEWPHEGAHPCAAGASRSFVTSGDPETFARLGARFLGPEVSGVEHRPWT